MYNNQELLTFKIIAEGTSAVVGKDFLKELVKHLAEAIDVCGAWVTESLEDGLRLRALAFWLNGKYIDPYEFYMKGTPCEVVLEQEGIYHVPDKIVQLFPEDTGLRDISAVSYMGVVLKDGKGRILGNLGVLDNKPMHTQPRILNIFRIFAARAAAELQRFQVEKQVQESEQRSKRLINGTYDAIIELDEHLQITQINSAAKELFSLPDVVAGYPLKNILSIEGLQKITSALLFLKEKITEVPYYWLQEYIGCLTTAGKPFPAQASITEYYYQNKSYYILILRNVVYRLEAEEKIKTLSIETQFLREEIKKIYNLDEIVGSSPHILMAMDSVRLVAPTNAAVLLTGETGTGKELFARAIHNSSTRKDKPMIKLNCAALPANLIESELFGHEKGAFTGASARREGRFALADKGSIFLDEIGEFPLELQPKLLRVLQEGEFEAVGSDRTQKVDVRLIAATNRNLLEEVRKGRFREDLYYRLNVYPIHIPPLRERGEDVLLLAEQFLARFARSMNKTLPPLSENDRQKILSYRWPGNVRELQNVMERIVITSEKNVLKVNIDNSPADRLHQAATPAKIITAAEWRQLEKENILRALTDANWKISGPQGAAALLDMPATTLSSKLKALGINKIPLTTFN